MTEDKKTLLSWREAMAGIVGVFVAGIASFVAATNYIDNRMDEKYFTKTNGELLQQRVETDRNDLSGLSKKMDDLQTQQTIILVKLGEISAKLDQKH